MTASGILFSVGIAMRIFQTGLRITEEHSKSNQKKYWKSVQRRGLLNSRSIKSVFWGGWFSAVFICRLGFTLPCVCLYHHHTSFLVILIKSAVKHVSASKRSMGLISNRCWIVSSHGIISSHESKLIHTSVDGILFVMRFSFLHPCLCLYLC